MKSFGKLLLSAMILCGGACAMGAQEKTTVAGVPVVRLKLIYQTGQSVGSFWQKMPPVLI